MNNSGIGYVIVAICAAFAAWWFLSHEIRTEQTVRVDTVVTQLPPVRIEAKGRVRYVRDTVYVAGASGAPTDSIIVRDTTYTTRPFIATLDTVINNDTASLMFRYPSMMFAMSLRHAPDTTTQTLIQTPAQPEPRSVWTDVAIVVGAFTAGILVGGR